ncbi:DUF2637 domain-containing protein [Streptomyces sp. NPDC001667]
MTRKAKGFLVAALVAVVVVAFRVSWNALRDVARAIGADAVAATLYPFVVDGLMALALVATLVLAGADRRFALRVLASYTAASLVLNYVHGLVPALHSRAVEWGRLADWAPANWALVLLATSLPVGSIFFGSDLVARVLHHRPDTTPASPETEAEEASRSMPEQAEHPDPAPDESTPESTPGSGAPVGAVGPTPGPVTAGESAPDSPGPVPPGAVAESTGVRPRRATGRVPVAAKSPRPDRTRTLDELLDEARESTAADDELSAEKIRNTLRVGSARARQIRDLLHTERQEIAAQFAADEADRRHGLHLVTDDQPAPEPAAPEDLVPTGADR